MTKAHKYYIIFQILLLICFNTYSQSNLGKNVEIVFLNKYEFYIENKSGFPLTFVFEGDSILLPVTLKEKGSILDVLSIFEENIFIDLLKSEGNEYIETMRKLRAGAKYDRVSYPILIKPQKYPVDLDFEIIITEEQYYDNIAFIINYLGLSPKFDINTIINIMISPDETFQKELRNLPLLIVAKEEYEKLTNIYENKIISNVNTIPVETKFKRSITPMVGMEFGIHGNVDISEYWNGIGGSAKLAFSPFPEIVWSTSKLRASRLYLTALYESTNHRLKNDSITYVGSSILNGSVENEMLSGNDGVYLNSKSVGLGIRLQNNLSPKLFFYLEGGVVKRLTHFSLKIDDPIFDDNNVDFSQDFYEDAILADKETYPYMNFGVGIIGGQQVNYFYNRQTRRGVTLVLNMIASQPGVNTIQDPYQFYNDQSILLPLIQSSSNKIDFSYSLSLGIFL